MLLKRQAFAVLSGELDQYHLYLPLIQGKKTCPPPAHPPPKETGPEWPTWLETRGAQGRCWWNGQTLNEYSAEVIVEELWKYIGKSETLF